MKYLNIGDCASAPSRTASFLLEGSFYIGFGGLETGVLRNALCQ